MASRTISDMDFPVAFRSASNHLSMVGVEGNERMSFLFIDAN
jgi:hypothetical protein